MGFGFGFATASFSQATQGVQLKRFRTVALVTGFALFGGVVALSGTTPAGAGQFPGTNGKIAYSKSLSPCYCDNIWLINADGTGDTQLTFGTSGYSTHPSWSPDGTLIAFTSNRDGYWEVYTMNTNGTNQTQVTTTAGGNSQSPAWQSIPIAIPTTTTVAPTTTASPADVAAVTATPAFTG